MKPAWTVLLALVVVGEVFANGSMWDTPHRASGNVLLPSERFTLAREELDLRLDATDYEAKVTYLLNDGGAQKGRSATFMYFPVICSYIDGQGEANRCI